MLKDGRLMAFVATRKPEEAKAFYAGVLGLRLLGDEPYALVFDCGGTMLRVQKAAEVTPAPYTSLGWQVQDLGGVVAALTEKGVTLQRYPYLDQDARGVWRTPDGSQVAWFKDPDGNVLSLTQFAASRA